MLRSTGKNCYWEKLRRGKVTKLWLGEENFPDEYYDIIEFSRGK